MVRPTVVSGALPHHIGSLLARPTMPLGCIYQIRRRYIRGVQGLFGAGLDEPTHLNRRLHCRLSLTLGVGQKAMSFGRIPPGCGQVHAGLGAPSPLCRSEIMTCH